MTLPIVRQSHKPKKKKKNKNNKKRKKKQLVIMNQQQPTNKRIDEKQFHVCSTHLHPMRSNMNPVKPAAHCVIKKLVCVSSSFNVFIPLQQTAGFHIFMFLQI